MPSVLVRSGETGTGVDAREVIDVRSLCKWFLAGASLAGFRLHVGRNRHWFLGWVTTRYPEAFQRWL
jgi:hypothetical protein